MAEENLLKSMPKHFPTIETVEVFQFDPSRDPHAYIDVLKVTGDDADVLNVKILIESDIGTVHTDIEGLFANQDTTLVNRVHAIDPTSITARITSYQLSE